MLEKSLLTSGFLDRVDWRAVSASNVVALHLVNHAAEYFDQLRVELGACPVAKLGDRFLLGATARVGTFAAHRVVGVADADHAGAERDLLPGQPVGVALTIPTLVRDMARIEDVEKIEGDDPADAARYGLKSRYATRAAYSTERLPYEARLASRVLSADPTVRAIQARKAQLEEQHRAHFVPRRGR